MSPVNQVRPVTRAAHPGGRKRAGTPPHPPVPQAVQASKKTAGADRAPTTTAAHPAAEETS
ncbi:MULTISPECIES: hypothetical protein [unclassified Streptomyces]|uniref:hypothetical protein n=1 Tax=unclassified Streptomyces TaxID=2593676 RepID=UPI0033BE03C5